MLNTHSTRLLPRLQGADKYKITGIASKCDWVILTDYELPHTHLHKNKKEGAPKTIFLSLRYHERALQYFTETILPQIDSAFTLVSGSSDATVPYQVDKRWVPLNAQNRRRVAIILDHPHLHHWVAENADNVSHPLMSPLPLGLVYSDAPQLRETMPVPRAPDLAKRPLNILCGHRVREGQQWEARKAITDTAKAHWASFTTILDEDIPEDAFLNLIDAHSFVLCAEGGGLDPSPKAWQALLRGAIPIIRRNSLYDAYKHLPVVFVDDWSADALTLDKLELWKNDRLQIFDDTAQRANVLERLSLEYWWDYIPKP